VKHENKIEKVRTPTRVVIPGIVVIELSIASFVLLLQNH